MYTALKIAVVGLLVAWATLLGMLILPLPYSALITIAVSVGAGGLAIGALLDAIAGYDALQDAYADLIDKDNVKGD